jgi:hypothetical protein
MGCIADATKEHGPWAVSVCPCHGRGADSISRRHSQDDPWQGEIARPKAGRGPGSVAVEEIENLGGKTTARNEA